MEFGSSLESCSAYANYGLLNEEVASDNNKIFSRDAAYEDSNLQCNLQQIEDLYDEQPSSIPGNENNEDFLLFVNSKRTTDPPAVADSITCPSSFATSVAPPVVVDTSCRTTVSRTPSPRFEAKLFEDFSKIDSTKSRGLIPQMMYVDYHPARKVAQTKSYNGVGKRKGHASLMRGEHLEHVERERKRRDDMSSKIATLETLLPFSSKRDKASILHDGILYVEALQQRVKSLQDRLKEASRRPQAGVKGSNTLTTCSNVDFGVKSTTGSRLVRDIAVASARSSQSPILVDEPHRSGSMLGNQRRRPISVQVEFHVQVYRPGEQVQVVKCECKHSYLSIVMRTLEQLQLTLHRCTITKLHDYMICVIIIKPTSNCSTAHVVSSAQIATLLHIATGKD